MKLGSEIRIFFPIGVAAESCPSRATGSGRHASPGPAAWPGDVSMAVLRPFVSFATLFSAGRTVSLSQGAEVRGWGRPDTSQAAIVARSGGAEQVAARTSGRDETAAAAGMCAGRRYAGPCGCRCRARIVRGRASSASDRAQVVAHDASRRTPWPRYASCLGLHRTDLEDDMPRQEPIHPMPALACEALSASGVIRP